ncbi:MAG TPA: S1-like domain-containing RNA-binding protein [Lachnospiraceae bacterium]|nr:S1-like domain-containing RNA-binding protein [Lachnospiraceae bacterium]HPF28910.1 S1-like domain-containing RNA-binding protein [Lachnospiraceae bacterium]
MLRVGEMQELEIVKTVEFGVYLIDPSGNDMEERVLLPGKQVPEGAECKSHIEVFLYKDSKDRLIATTNTPKLTLGQMAVLRVSQVNKMGAFLDWGLEKDLFLPFRQQTRKVEEGDEVLVALYLDKSARLAATMNVYRYLKTDSPYSVGDEVDGILYEDSDNFGMFVAVDEIYSAIIPMNELFGNLRIGDRIHGRVTKIREDGKMNLSIREKSYVQMYPDMEKILTLLDSYQGVLPFTEKASPEVINRETGMSKNEFKRAIGHLYKEKKIVIIDGRIKKAEED